MVARRAESLPIELVIQFREGEFFGRFYAFERALSPIDLPRGHILSRFLSGEAEDLGCLVSLDGMYSLFRLHAEGALDASGSSVRFFLHGASALFTGEAPVCAYRYDEGEACLRRFLPDGCQHLAGRFFLFGGAVACVPDVGSNSLVEKGLLSGMDIVQAAKRGLHPNLEASVRLSGTPDRLLSLRKAEKGEVELFLKTVCPPGRLRPLKGLSNLALDGELIRRVMSGRLEEEIFKGRDSVILRGAEIPQFRDAREKAIARYGDADCKKRFDSCVAQRSDIRFDLALAKEERGGVGRARFAPTLSAGRARVRLSDALDGAEGGYARIGECWARLADLEAIGAVRGAEAAIEISALELLHRGSSRLEGPWGGVDAPLAEWRSHAPWTGVAESHLEFLRAYGLNGAACAMGDGASKAEALRYAASLPDKGAKTLLAMPSGFFGGRSGALGAPRLAGGPLPATLFFGDLASEGAEAALSQEWDILFLFEPEAPSCAQALPRLSQIRARLRLGSLSADFDSLSPEGKASALEALEIDLSLRSPFYAPYAIRGKNASLALPQAHRMGKGLEGLNFMDLSGEGDLSQAGLLPGQSVEERGGIRILRAEAIVAADVAFAAAARALEAREGKPCMAEPFSAHWPNYAAMSEKQLNWHFFWRGMARKGAFLPTPLPYVTLACYEAINGAGWQDPREGLAFLSKLWREYRDAYPLLNKSVPGWILDFAILFRLQAEAEGIAGKGLGEFSSILFGLKAEELYIQGQSPIAAEDMERLSGYSPEKSRFAAREGLEAVRAEMLFAVNAIDGKMRKETGKGLIASLCPPKRRKAGRIAFPNALYAGNARYTVEYCDFSEAGALSRFLAGAMKRVENRMRAKAGYGRPLKAPILGGGWESFLESLNIGEGAAKPAAPKRVKIQFGEMDQIRSDSAFLKGILLTDGEKPEAPPLPEALPASSGSGGMQAAIARLSPAQASALEALASGAGLEGVEGVARSFGLMGSALLDSVNEAFEEETGDLLIDFSLDPPEISEEYREDLLLHLSKKGR
jgi:hypothetical protein